MKLVKNLKWRYATKKYDTTKKVSQHHIDYIKEAVQLTASSYGMQPYKILEITNPELREELRPLAWNQAPITDASHLFIFCNKVTVDEDDIEAMMQLRVEKNPDDKERITNYGKTVKRNLSVKSPEVLFHWSAKQTYMALSTALSACAELQIDSTPMEGFDADPINEKLGLKEEGWNAAVLLAVGYRHEDDVAQHAEKVRKPMGVMFEEL